MIKNSELHKDKDSLEETKGETSRIVSILVCDKLSGCDDTMFDVIVPPSKQ